MSKFRDVKSLQKFDLPTPQSITISTTNDISTAATFSNKTEPLPWPSGVYSLPKH